MHSTMKCDREVLHPVKSRGIAKMKTHRVFLCPRARCEVKEVMCQKSGGYTNPYRHLLRCYGNETALFDAFRVQQEKTDRNLVLASFPVSSLL